MTITRRALLGAAAGTAACGAAPGHIDPRAFGARFDGVTDDTAAWQKAVDRAAELRVPVIARGGVSRLVCRPQPIGRYGNTGLALFRAVDIDRPGLTIIGENAEVLLTGHGGREAVNYAFATPSHVRRGALRDMRILGLRFDFSPAGDPSVNKRALHLCGAQGVELSDLALRSSGKRAGGTLTLQNCAGVRMSRLRFDNVTQGMNLSYVDDLVGADWRFDNFSEAVDFDRMVRNFRLTNLRFRGRGRTSQCLDLNSCSNGTVSGVEVSDVGNIAIVNYKTTTPPTYDRYLSDSQFAGPPFQPSVNVLIEKVRGSGVGVARGVPSFQIGGEQRHAAQNAFANARITLRDVQLTDCPGAVMIEQVKDFLLEDVSIDGAVPISGNAGAIDIRARRPGAEVSGVLRRVKLGFRGSEGAGLRASAPGRLVLEDVAVTGPTGAKTTHYEFASLDQNRAALSLARTVARAAGGAGGRAFKFGDNGQPTYEIAWGEGSRQEGPFAAQPVIYNGHSRRRVKGR